MEEESRLKKIIFIVAIVIVALAIIAASVFFILREKLYPKYIVTLDANGGTVEQSQMSVRYKRSYNLPTPKKEGFSFYCWTYKGEYVPLAGKWAIKEDADLVANWEIRDEKGIVYTNVEGGLEVTAIRGKEYDEILIPSAYNGIPIISIRNGAFDNCKPIVEDSSLLYFPIYVHSNVKNIGENVIFNDKMVVKYYDELHSTEEFDLLKLNNEIEIISYKANYEKDLTIPEKYNDVPITKIGRYVFYGAQNKISQSSYTFFRIFIPTTVRAIDEYAFADCLGVKCSLYYYNDKGEFREMIDLPQIVNWIDKTEIHESNQHVADVISMLRSAIGWSKYTAARINVKFDANGGELNVENQQLRYGGEYTLPTPTKAGHIFVGWFMGTELIEQSGERWKISNHITLTAKWEEIE